MAQNFINEGERSKRLGFADGFRFGFGFFIANLLGLTVVGAIGLAISYLTGQL